MHFFFMWVLRLAIHLVSGNNIFTMQDCKSRLTRLVSTIPHLLIIENKKIDLLKFQ